MAALPASRLAQPARDRPAGAQRQGRGWQPRDAQQGGPDCGVRDSGGVLALQTLLLADEIRVPTRSPATRPAGPTCPPAADGRPAGRGDERDAEPAGAGVFCAGSVLCALATATGLLTTRARCHRPRHTHLGTWRAIPGPADHAAPGAGARQISRSASGAVAVQTPPWA